MHDGEVVGGRFEVRRLVGRGRMGSVHEALDRQTSKPVALKRLLHHRDDAVVRFAREAAIAASLTHEHVVRHVAHGAAADGSLYLAMEWVEGEDLAVRLAGGALGVAEAVVLARGIADGLAAAHARAIVHRDVKPSNVLLDRGRVSSPKLTDFGVARVLGAATALTRTGQLIGTPSYMAPEQVRGGDALDALVDVFALGCVLYHCLAGRPPFEGADVRVIFAKIVFAEAARLRSLREDVPAELEALVMSMLEKDPTRRPPSCVEIRDTLDGIADLSRP